MAVVLGTAFLTNLNWPNHDSSAARGQIQRTAAADNAAAVSYTISSPPTSELIRSLCAKIQRVSRKGPTAKGQLDELLGQLRVFLAASNPAEVVSSLRPEELTTPLGTAALEAWLKADCMAASTWLARHSAATENHAWLVAHALTQQPEALGDFCDTLGEGPWAQAFLDHASREVLRKSPAAAVSLASSLPPGERQTRLFETIACDWMNRDPSAARAWIDAVPDPILRRRLVAVGAESYASAAPLPALEWLLDRSPPEHLPRQSIKTIVGIWRETTPENASAWSSRFPVIDAPPQQSLLH